ncbi:hypothetical protein [Burkholderia sp. PAMC 26561]|nr:hypothetical protein [Burkholderia sp. PAMC 26561]
MTTRSRVIPYALFVEPKLGRIGPNETDAASLGMAVRVVKLPVAGIPRAPTKAIRTGS